MGCCCCVVCLFGGGFCCCCCCFCCFCCCCCCCCLDVNKRTGYKQQYVYSTTLRYNIQNNTCLYNVCYSFHKTLFSTGRKINTEVNNHYSIRNVLAILADEDCTNVSYRQPQTLPLQTATNTSATDNHKHFRYRQPQTLPLQTTTNTSVTDNHKYFR